MPLYRNILKQALAISWRYKYLWIFGLFASLLGSGGEYQIINNIINGNTGTNVAPDFNQIAGTGVFSKDVLNYLIELFKNNPVSMSFALLGTLLLIALALTILWIMTSSQAALVNESARIIKRTKGKTDLKETFQSGAKKFWPVFGFNILAKFLICVCFILIGLPIIFYTSSSSSVTALYILLFTIFVPISIILSFIVKYAIAYAVINDVKFMTSLKKGWELFLKNWLVSIETAIILFSINFFGGIGIILLILMLAIPLFFLALVLSYLFNFFIFWICMIIAGVLFLIIIVLGGSVLTTFQVAAWTGLFIELNEKGGTSKIMRVAENLNKQNK